MMGTAELKGLAGQEAIALRGTEARVRLSGMCQNTTLRQTWVNQEARAIEGVYTFPLPPDAAVCGFVIHTAEREITGEIEEREKAQDVYDEAVNRGHGAYLLDQERPDIFTVNVGNLNPGQAVTTEIRYVAPLQFQERVLRLALPTTVAPRYVTATGQSDPLAAASDGDRVNPPQLLWVPYGLRLDLQVQLGRRVRRLSSPSHALTVNLHAETDASATFQGGVGEMNRDLVVELELDADVAPVATAGTWPQAAADEHFLAVTFLPELGADTAPTPQEIVFLLDCSGSMQGSSITQARAALELCLRSLRNGDRFNIWRFGSTFDRYRHDAAVYSEASLGEALRYVHTIDADLGGTELHQPLAALVAEALAPGCARREIILLTDGQVSNEAAIIDLARQHAATHRIFTFGIGAASSQYLVTRLAEVTHGAAEFVAPGERIEEKILRTFSRVGSPAVTDVRVEWGDGRVDQAPATVPPVFDGDPLQLFARVEGALPATIALACMVGGKAQRWSVPVRATQDTVQALLWARRRLQDLESTAGEPVPQLRARTGPERRADKALIALSKRFGLMCSRTSYIAVEKRHAAERTDGRPEYRRIPVQLAQGWHGIDMAHGMAAGCGSTNKVISLGRRLSAADMGNMSAWRSATSAKRGRLAGSGRSFSLAPKLAAKVKGWFGAAPGGAASPPDSDHGLLLCESDAPPPCAPLAPQQAAPQDPLLALLMTQSAAGWFVWDPEFDSQLQREALPPERTANLPADAAGAPLRQAVLAFLGKDLPADVGANDPALRRQLLDTLLVLWLLGTRHADRRALWQRHAAKARRWLGTHHVQAP